MDFLRIIKITVTVFLLKWQLYLCGQGLDRLQVEVIVQMQVVEVLAVDKQIEHVVALPTNLQAHFHPVQLGGLKELGGLERAEEVPKRKIENIYSF